MPEEKLTAKYTNSNEPLVSCECGKLSFHHATGVHLDHTNDELQKMFDEEMDKAHERINEDEDTEEG